MLFAIPRFRANLNGVRTSSCDADATESLPLELLATREGQSSRSCYYFLFFPKRRTVAHVPFVEPLERSEPASQPVFWRSTVPSGDRPIPFSQRVCLQIFTSFSARLESHCYRYRLNWSEEPVFGVSLRRFNQRCDPSTEELYSPPSPSIPLNPFRSRQPSQTACPTTARFSPADKSPQPRRQQDVLTRPEDPDSPAQPAATSLPLAPVPETLVVHADHLSSPQRNHNSYPVGNPPPSQQHGAEAVRGSSGDEVLSSSAQNASVRSRARSGGTPSHNTWLGPPLEQSPQKASHSRARSEVARPAAEDNMHGALPSIYQNSSTRAISGSGGGG